MKRKSKESWTIINCLLKTLFLAINKNADDESKFFALIVTL